MVRHFCFCLCVLLAGSTAGVCGIRPSFMLDYSSWHATNIVVVTPLGQDGIFQVLESWKGDLLPGTVLSVPELAPEPTAVSIDRYPEQPSYEISTKVPVTYPGSKIVLYLKGDTITASSTGKARHWAPSNPLDNMKASAAWIRDGLAYGFVQIFNPGESVFVRLQYVTELNASGMRMVLLTESSLKERTFDVLRLHQQMDAAVTIQDRAARAEALKSFADSRIRPAMMFALEELGKCGTSALPTIRSMLDDAKFSKEAAQLIEQYAIAGGIQAAPELTARLQADLRFWQAIGPALPVGWWNRVDESGVWAETQGYRDRYSQTLALIRALDKLHYEPATPTAMLLSQLWKSWPQLNDPAGLNRMAEEADQLVQHLQTGSSDSLH